MKLSALNHVAIGVRDVQASAAWYCEVLGLERLHDDAWGDCPAIVGDPQSQTGIALFQGADDGRLTDLLHIAFRLAPGDFESAQRELRERRIEYRTEDHGLWRSIYLHDPDGYEVELAAVVV